MSEHPPVVIRVTKHPGKPTVRELLVEGLKVYEFRNKAEAVDFMMQFASTFRYD